MSVSLYALNPNIVRNCNETVQTTLNASKTQRFKAVIKTLGFGTLTGIVGTATLISPPFLVFATLVVCPPLIFGLPLLDSALLYGGWKQTKKMARICRQHFHTTSPANAQSIQDTSKQQDVKNVKEWKKYAWLTGGVLATAAAVASYAITLAALGFGILALVIGAIPGPSTMPIVMLSFAVMIAARIATIGFYELARKCFHEFKKPVYE